MSNELQRLQQWYRAQCNGDWEHSYGVMVDTLDNPGWRTGRELSRTPAGCGRSAERSGRNQVGRSRRRRCRLQRGFEPLRGEGPRWLSSRPVRAAQRRELRIDLEDTDLATAKFPRLSVERSNTDWVHCNVEKSAFHGQGGAENLTELLDIFLRWAEKRGAG